MRWLVNSNVGFLGLPKRATEPGNRDPWIFEEIPKNPGPRVASCGNPAQYLYATTKRIVPMKKIETTSLDAALHQFIGPLGTSEREAFEQELSAEILGRSVRHARLSKGLTQEQLGQLVGVQKAQISRIENRVRDVRLDTVLRVLGVLGLQIRFRVVPISEAGHELG